MSVTALWRRASSLREAVAATPRAVGGAPTVGGQIRAAPHAHAHTTKRHLHACTSTRSFTLRPRRAAVCASTGRRDVSSTATGSTSRASHSSPPVKSDGTVTNSSLGGATEARQLHRQSEQQSSHGSSSSSQQPPPPPPGSDHDASRARLRHWLLIGSGLGLVGLGVSAGAAWWFFVGCAPVVVEPPPEPKAASPTAALAEDLLAVENLPDLIKEHHALPLLQRLWFYVRLATRGILLSAIWTPVLACGLVLPVRIWMRLVVRMLELSGPVFIKLGQWAATRPDLFPQSICSRLARLQAEVAPHAFLTSLRTCQENFGATMERAGSRLILEERVIGSGSMGQVHHGWVVSPDGTRSEVAVKVMHPHIHSHVNLDLTLLYYVATVITHIPYSEMQWLSIPEMLIQFTGFMGSHLDLHQEAKNMSEFREYFKNNPNISFPAPIYPFVGREVLVQSLAHGIPLGQFLNDQALDRDHFDTDADPAHKSVAERITKSYLLKHEEALREAERTGSSAVPPPPPREPVSPLHSEIARLGLQMYLHMLMENNFVHSDLHPGNILVQMPDLGDQNGTTAENVRDLAHAYDESSSEFLKSQHVNLVILDSGLVSTLTPVNRRNFLSLFGALILRDGRLAARLMLHGAPKHCCTDPHALEEDMHEIVSAIPLENLGRVDLGRLLSEVMNCVRRHHVKLESDFASLVISLAIIEGIGRQLDPDMSLFHEAVPVMLKNKETRCILLQTAGAIPCAKIGLVIAKEELQIIANKGANAHAAVIDNATGKEE